jgi:signal transduction histidine kinase
MSRSSSHTSLRRSLLRGLGAPLSLLALMSGLLAYWLAMEYTQRVTDRSMVDLANAVSRQIELSGQDAPRTVPPLAHATFSDPAQALTYRISHGDQLIAGDPKLPIKGTVARRVHNAQVFEAPYRGNRMRIAQVRVVAQGDPILIEVAQPVGHGYRVAAEFLMAIMMPLVILLMAGWVIVWRVVNQELDPLTDLAASLNKQTHTSLEPIDEAHVPLEIRPLTHAVNALLERLKTALEAQRKFIADAAHQLRTPLTAIKLHAEHACTARDPQHTQTALHELRTSADRAVRLSNQLLSLARAEPGEQAAHFVNVDLAVLAFETGAEWVPRALAVDVDLGFNEDAALTGAPLLVRGNPVLLREVMANLIDNALKYVPPSRQSDGRVTVSVRRADVATRTDRLDDRLHDAATTQTGDTSALTVHGVARTLTVAEIAVEDNGPGVPASQQRDLFKRFFRGDAQSGNDGAEGSGLGLAIVRDIIVLHGGSVHYESAHGGGARFVVRIPSAPRAPDKGV